MESGRVWLQLGRSAVATAAAIAATAPLDTGWIPEIDFAALAAAPLALGAALARRFHDGGCLRRGSQLALMPRGAARRIEDVEEPFVDGFRFRVGRAGRNALAQIRGRSLYICPLPIHFLLRVGPHPHALPSLTLRILFEPICSVNDPGGVPHALPSLSLRILFELIRSVNDVARTQAFGISRTKLRRSSQSHA